MSNDKLNEKIERKELLKLHTHYENVCKNELDFFFKYFNFYIGLLSALVVVTFSTLFSIKEASLIKFHLLLLIAPTLVIFLSLIAYYFIRIYYRRFLEALVTLYNIKSMLRYSHKTELASNVEIPIPFPSRFGGGFITQFNRKETKRILDNGLKNGSCAEDVLDELLKCGDTLNYAKYTLILYSAVAAVLFFFIMFWI